MYSLKTLSKQTIFRAALGVLAAMALVIAFVPAKQTEAQAVGGQVTGFLWSSNIGLIYMSGSGASVAITPNSQGTIGVFSGYGWSPNIGTVSFNAADVSLCGTSSAPQLNFTNGQVSGYARALSGNTAGSGGWNGCISLRGTSPAHGVTFDGTTGKFSGYAWGYSTNPGNSVIGWVDWQGVSYSKSWVDLKVNNQDSFGMTSAGGPVTLSWQASGASSCSGDTQWAGPKTTPSGTQTVTVPASTSSAGTSKTYTITCTGASGIVTDSVIITLTGGSSSYFSFYAAPTSVLSGASATLSWQTQNLTSCAASGDWSGITNSNPPPATLAPTATPNGTYNFVIPNITTSKSFTLTCTGPSGTLAPQTVTVTVKQPSCAVIPSSAVISAPASPATVSNVIKKFGIEWKDASGFPSVNIVRGTSSPGVSFNIGGNPVTSATDPSNTITTSSAPVTATLTVEVLGTPTNSAYGPCTPATLHIVPPGYCQDPLALNVGEQGACKYGPGTKPVIKRPPWEEL